MSKTRKTLIVICLVLGSALIFISFFAKLEHWSNMEYCAIALSGLLFATTALILTMRGTRAK